MRNAIGLALLLPLCSCTPSAPSAVEPDHQEVSQPAAPPTRQQARQRMDDGVFDPYDRANYPRTFKLVGKPDPVKRIQAIREGAAFKAIASGRCDRVELSEISENRSTKANLSAFVDCTNRERFYVSESDLAANAVATANSDRTLPRAQAISACVDAARGIATYPSLVDPHTWTGASYSASKTMGAARVLLDFDATNAFGVKIPYSAACLFPAGHTTPELNVTPRH